MQADILIAQPKKISSLAAREKHCAECLTRPEAVCGGVPQAAIAQLAELSTSLKIAYDGEVISEGDEARHRFSVTRGIVRIHKLLPDGRRQVIGFLGRGDFFGLPVRESYAYTAEAVTEVELCRFSRSGLETLLRQHHSMERKLFAMAANELALAQDQILLLGRKTAAEKLASFLLQTTARFKELTGRGSDLFLPMTRSDVADHLGLTMETVSRCFSQFRKRGLIELIGSDKVNFLDLDGLKDVAEGEA